jgi:hypothetical protein
MPLNGKEKFPFESTLEKCSTEMIKIINDKATY